MHSRLRYLAAFIVCVTTGSMEHARGGMTANTVIVDNAYFPVSNSALVASFDVWFESSSPLAQSIVAFQFELSLIGPDNAVTFLDVLAPSAHPYVFAGSSAGPLFSISGSGDQVLLGDFLDTGTADLANGAGFASVKVLVQPEAAGKTYTVQINPDPGVSYLASSATDFLTFVPRAGSITAVPEASTLAFCFAFALAASFCRMAKTSPVDRARRNQAH